jgi:hypothetical protein
MFFVHCEHGKDMIFFLRPLSKGTETRPLDVEYTRYVLQTFAFGDHPVCKSLTQECIRNVAPLNNTSVLRAVVMFDWEWSAWVLASIANTRRQYKAKTPVQHKANTLAVPFQFAHVT